MALLLLVPFCLFADPVPGKDDRLVAQMVCEILQEGHVTQPMIGDEISRRLFQRFLKDIDPSKTYFLKSDIDEFKKHETELDDMLLQGDLSFAYKVYGRFLERIGQRLKLIEELVDTKFDFTVKEYLDTDYAKIDYAANDQELRERWRKRIKFDLLRERLGAKPLPEAEGRQKVRERYQGFAKRMKQMDNYDLMEIYLSSYGRPASIPTGPTCRPIRSTISKSPCGSGWKESARCCGKKMATPLWWKPCPAAQQPRTAGSSPMIKSSPSRRGTANMSMSST